MTVLLQHSPHLNYKGIKSIVLRSKFEALVLLFELIEFDKMLDEYIYVRRAQCHAPCVVSNSAVSRYTRARFAPWLTCGFDGAVHAAAAS